MINVPTMPYRTPLVDEQNNPTQPWVKWWTSLTQILKQLAFVLDNLQIGVPTADPKVFTFTANPVVIFLDGLQQRPTIDYTVSGFQITFTFTPAGGQTVYAIVST